MDIFITFKYLKLNINIYIFTYVNNVEEVRGILLNKSYYKNILLHLYRNFLIIDIIFIKLPLKELTFNDIIMVYKTK